MDKGDGLRTPFVAGNWKMNTTSDGVRQLLENLKCLVKPLEGVDLAVCPPFPYLRLASEILEGSCIDVGAQNCHWEGKGAYTGEVASGMLEDAGCRFVILGHSERRQIFHETDRIVRQKLERILGSTLQPIVCVGETLAEREKNLTESVVLDQIEASLKELSEEWVNRITLAYEPIWAIGTGMTASPEQAQEVHRLIRGWIGDHVSKQSARAVRIQYGGSVKPENAGALFDQPDIDGALVGGASLKAEDFIAIAAQAARQEKGDTE
jgi:triosephosphate isomerase